MTGFVLLFLRILLVLLLYAFLVWVLVTLYRGFRQETRWLADRKIPILQLSLPAAAADETLRFSQPQVTLGRNPACDMVIEDDTVSAQHAQLVYRHDQWWVDDLNSTNGTFLNGQRVTSLIVVTTGDLLRLGRVDLSVAIQESNGAS